MILLGKNKRLQRAVAAWAFFSGWVLCAHAAEQCPLPLSSMTPTAQERQSIAACLQWQTDPKLFCQGDYQASSLQPLADPKLVQIESPHASFYEHRPSQLSGGVRVRYQEHQLKADKVRLTPAPHRKTLQEVYLEHQVQYLSPLGLMWAKQGWFYPNSKKLQINQVLYRLDLKKQRGSQLFAWGQAHQVNRTENGLYLFKKATYTQCAPLDNAWSITAESLMIDREHQVGVAKQASLRIKDYPVLYTPYLSFPLKKQRKSGFLMPLVGSTSISGFDLATPYYLNLAPNYDATFVPHYYSRRGVMLGGKMRYLTPNSRGVFRGNFLPDDQAWSLFLNQYQASSPILQNQSKNRWDVQWIDGREWLLPDLKWNVNFRQLSDDYYLQDFSTNLGKVTERQILREASVDYQNEHWLLKGVAQSYQTLHPLNETPVSDIYARLPQVLAQAHYDDLPYHGHFSVLGSVDDFQWTSSYHPNPNGVRAHINPVFSIENRASWGYVTPMAQWVGHHYDFQYDPNHSKAFNTQAVDQLNIQMPRLSLDAGLNLERSVRWFNQGMLQTLEPRMYYLNVPYQNQSQIPAFDSAYMIFSAEQVFRDNRFSGYDRIGDANQLGYGMTTRWLDDESGIEKLSLTVAQLKYFSDRKVQLCYDPSGVCQDTPLMLGYTSPTASWSPIASQGVYHLNRLWSVLMDYVWDPAISGTNNGQVKLNYQAPHNRILSFGYSYLVNADVTQLQNTATDDNALNQMSVAFAWPFSDRWSGLGAYSYNISKHYEMMTFLGLQYDSCCWGLRLVGGRNFRNLQTPMDAQFTNSIFLQIFLKGLGSVGNSDPMSTLNTVLPGYADSFKS
jgi:LPS-assembly protein